MTQVRIALRASYFDANHTVARISDFHQVCTIQGLPETWPTAARIELAVAPKEGKAAADAGVRTHAPFVVICSCVGSFGSGLSRDSKGLGAELSSPLGFGFGDFFHSFPSLNHAVRVAADTLHP